MNFTMGSLLRKKRNTVSTSRPNPLRSFNNKKAAAEKAAAEKAAAEKAAAEKAAAEKVIVEPETDDVVNSIIDSAINISTSE